VSLHQNIGSKCEGEKSDFEEARWARFGHALATKQRLNLNTFMKLELYAAVLATLATMGCSTTTSGSDTDADKLAGSWKCRSATVNGKPLPQEVVNQLQLNLTTKHYQTKKGDQVLFDSVYSLDTSKKPREINIVGTEGDFAGKTAQGIYVIERDDLTLCYTMPGKERPKDFENKEGSEVHLTHWYRGK